MNKNPYADKDKKAPYLKQIKNALQDFHIHRQKMLIKDQEVPTENILLKVNSNITFDLEQVIS